MAFGSLAGLDGELSCALGEASEDASGVKPFAAGLGKESVPVEVAGLELGSGAVAAIDAAFGTTDSEAALGEVDGIADAFAHAIVGHPFDEAGIDTALEDEVLDEAANFVIGEGGEDAGAMREATAQAADHIVFAPAFPGGELAGGADSALAGIKAEHDFAESEDVDGRSGHGRMMGIDG